MPLIGVWQNNKTYYDNGQLESEGSFKDGKKEGLWNFYYSTGTDFYKGYFNNLLKLNPKIIHDEQGGVC